jgi:hypothetical protein
LFLSSIAFQEKVRQDQAEWLEHPTANPKVTTVLDSIPGAADEAVLNKVRKNKNPKKEEKKVRYVRTPILE